MHYKQRCTRTAVSHNGPQELNPSHRRIDFLPGVIAVHWTMQMYANECVRKGIRGNETWWNYAIKSHISLPKLWMCWAPYTFCLNKKNGVFNGYFISLFPHSLLQAEAAGMMEAIQVNIGQYCVIHPCHWVCLEVRFFVLLLDFWPVLCVGQFQSEEWIWGVRKCWCHCFTTCNCLKNTPVLTKGTDRDTLLQCNE